MVGMHGGERRPRTLRNILAPSRHLVRMATARSTGGFSSGECEALNTQRNIDTHRQWQVTKAVLCDTEPAACVSEFLFAHEFYWSEREAAAKGGIKCAKWRRDEQWPTIEPHLSRPSGLGGLWEEVLQLMPNRTLWLHGDSIMTQVCEASLCSLFRSGAVPQPPLCTNGRNPSTQPCGRVDEVGRSVGMQIRGVRLPNGAQLLCSAVGVLEREKIATVLQRLPEIGVAVINYGLHYHSNQNFELMLDELSALLRRWAASSSGRIPLWRELSAQHFRGGSWRPGAHRPPPGTQCHCEPLEARDADDGPERVAQNQNVQFNRIAAARAAQTGIGIVPFFNLTRHRHDMHRRHFCSFSNQRQVGRCCDCTHLCYTPLFWDFFFAGLRDSILTHPSFQTSPGAVEEAAADRQGGSRRAGRRARRWRRTAHAAGAWGDGNARRWRSPVRADL